MNENHPSRRWNWPLAFFILNAAAILIWFLIHAAPEEREMTIIGITPAGPDVNPAVIDEIKVTYNLPLLQDSVKPDSLRFIPPLSGKTEPAGKESLRFIPGEPLRPATIYTIVPSADLRGEKGEIPRQELLELATTRLQLESFAQSGFDRDSYTVELTFNQPVSPAELEKAIITRFSVSRAAGSDDARVEVLGRTIARVQQLRIKEARSGFVLVTLPAGLPCVAGPLGLAENRTLLFRIGGAKHNDPDKTPEWARGLTPADLVPEVKFLGMTAEWESGSGVVRIRTTTPLDPYRAKDYIKVDPALPVTFSSAWNGLKVLGDFQPGKQYRVTLNKGLPASTVGDLAETLTRAVWFDDLPPRFAFTHGGGFLSPDGLLKVPVKTRNLGSIRLEIRRLYAANLVESLLRDYGTDVATEHSEPEITRRIVIEGPKNREKETLLDLRELTGGDPLGVYGLTLVREDRRWNRQEAVIAVSDLGLGVRCGKTTLTAWTTSIRNAVPRRDILVSLYSNKRRLLSENVSDQNGVTSLEIPVLPEGERPALVVAEGEHGEFSFVRLDRDNRSRGVAARTGDPYPGEYQVFITAERGVYRGGETALFSGLARGTGLSNAPALPLELTLTGPDGKRLKKESAQTDTLGRFDHNLALGEGYVGGVYALEARLPGQKDVLGKALFRVADYLPETLSIAMELLDEKSGDEDDSEHWKNRLLIKVSRLAGGDLGPLPVRVMASYAPEAFSPKGWENWTFGDARRKGHSAERREREAKLDADGRARVEWNNPDLAFPSAALMTVRVEASETGGRASSEILRKPVHSVPFYTGIRLPKSIMVAGEETSLPLAAVTPQGTVDETVQGEWRGSLNRIEYVGVMTRQGDRLVYDWVRKEIHEEDMTGLWENGRASLVLTPLAGGQYRLTIDSGKGGGCSFDFSVSGPGSTWHGENPELLTLKFDKNSYGVGEEAVITTDSPFAGKAMVTVETSEVIDHWLMDFHEGENTIRVKVSDALRPNAHIGVTLLRPARAEAEWKPHRLSGSGVLPVDNSDRRLEIALGSGEFLSPGKTGTVEIAVSRGDEPAANASVVFWAVDVGVLSLTDFRTPSPWSLFYGLRRSGVIEADMFSRLAPELSEWLGRDSSPGGDGAADDFARRLNPVFANRVKAAVIFNATLTTNEDGLAAATLPVPEFAGRLRLMCWAADENTMGSAEKEIDVKAPVSARASWPRFAAPGDELIIPVTVVNRSGKSGAIQVIPEGDDNLTISPSRLDIVLPDNGSGIVNFTALCGDAGVARASVTATMDDDRFSDRVEFSVRPPLLFARDSGVLILAPGEDRSLILAPGFMEKNTRVKLVAGGHPLINLTGTLDALLDYPYGCAEQTASRLLGLVYLPDLVALSRPGQLESGEISILATACIERLSTMQSANGAIKTWPKGGEELFWVSSQALFSLLESRAVGHPVPDALVNNLARWLDSRIDGQLSDANLIADGGESVAMACLALARADALKRSWLLRLEEIAEERGKKEKPLSSAALAFISEAVAVAGDVDAGLALYNRFKPSGIEPGERRNRVVELAAWLLASMAVGAHEDEQAAYANDLGAMIKEGFTRWSTKENSLVLTALGRYWQKVGPIPEATAFLANNGVKTTFSTRRGASWDKIPAGSRVEVKNPSEGSLRLFWMAEGVPLTGKAREEDVGLFARRRLYDSTGREVREPFELNRGEVYEVRLHITGKADDLVIADLLPAGLEIEDATVKGRKLKGNAARGLYVKNVEIRDDRLLVFASISGSGEYRYLARAVTGGRFAWPALDASRMYDATTRSVHGSGVMTIKEKAANDR